MFFRTIAFSLLFLTVQAYAAEEADDSDILFRNPFHTAFREFDGKGATAEIVDLEDGRALKITGGGLSRWLDLPEGETVLFSVMIRTENVTRNPPGNHWFGAVWKAMVQIDGKNTWPGAPATVGTTPWHRVSFKVDVPLGKKVSARIGLGLDSATGTVYYRDLTVRLLK